MSVQRHQFRCSSSDIKRHFTRGSVRFSSNRSRNQCSHNSNDLENDGETNRSYISIDHRHLSADFWYAHRCDVQQSHCPDFKYHIHDNVGWFSQVSAVILITVLGYAQWGPITFRKTMKMDRGMI